MIRALLALIAGQSLVLGGVALWSAPAALIVAGVELTLVALLFDAERADK